MGIIRFMSVLDWLAKRQVQKNEQTPKRDMPGDLWVKCFGCGEVLYNKDLEQNFKVCDKCGHHFRLTFQERVDYTFDKDSFKQTDQNLKSYDFLNFTDTETYTDRIEKARKKTGMEDCAVIGSAKLDGKNVMVAIMDFSYMGGSMGSVLGEKFSRIMERSIAEKAPLILFSASGGARMQEGILSLMQMAKVSALIAKMEQERVPYIVVLTDPTTGGTTASFAMLGDVHIAEPGALIGFAGPRVIEQTIRQKLPKGFQRSEYLLDHGMVDRVVHRREMRSVLTQLIHFYKA